MSREPLRIGSLCSGYRGLDMAVEEVFGGSTAWVSDVDPGANQILAHHWPAVPNLGDLTTTDWAHVEPVDIVCGGYPCQPFSVAGQRKGTSDERHIWPYIADALRVLRPRIAVFENVAGHLRLGFADVLADLARLGFDVEWCLVRASEVGAPHRRERLFILATAADAPREGLAREGIRGRAAECGAAPADSADLGHERGWRARGGRPGPTDGGLVAADAPRLGLGHARPAGERGMAATAVASRPAAHADTASVGWGEGWPEPAREQGGPDTSLGSAPDWGRYAPAVARWEAVTGRRAPWATDDRHRLSPAFVEWLMGLEAGHVTDVPGLTRTQQLKALGNGVVPQQAAEALRLLAARAAPALATAA